MNTGYKIDPPYIKESAEASLTPSLNPVSSAVFSSNSILSLSQKSLSNDLKVAPCITIARAFLSIIVAGSPPDAYTADPSCGPIITGI